MSEKTYQAECWKKTTFQIISMVFFVELRFRKGKWLLGGMYHPPQPDQYFFNTLDKTLDVYSNYENVLLIGDFNAQIGETHLVTFYINMT